MDPMQAISLLSARVAFDVVPDPARHAAERKESMDIGLPNILDPFDDQPATKTSVKPDAALGEQMTMLSAYAPTPNSLDPATLLDPALRLGIDLSGLREGLVAYRAGDIAAGDAAAANAKEEIVRTALEWGLLRARWREAGFVRIQKFIDTHPDWPANAWLRKRAEEALYSEKRAPERVRAFFAKSPPETTAGRIGLAQAMLTGPNKDSAITLARATWREDDMNGGQETAFRKIFGAFLTPADHKYRADRLFYKEQNGAAMRAADLAGKDFAALAKVRAAGVNEVTTEKLLATIPPALQKDPGAIFARIQWLRRTGKPADAAALMLTAPRDPALIINGDEWWTERRLLARKSLDTGDAATAYRLAAEHSASSREQRIEAEFHAGWIALRFLNDPQKAKPHFANVAAIAVTPLSKARAAYWQGRAADAAGDPATAFYETAAAEQATYYGQLAREKLGRTAMPMRSPGEPATGNDRAEVVRVVELLYASGAKDLAIPLVTESAQRLEGPAQIAALARIVARDRDAKVSLAMGKLVSYRGLAIDDLAFPIYGVPRFEPFSNSAALPMVYAIARQESAFDPKALSSAGAMGLMQMIPSTAKRTAQRAGVGFDAARMTSDAIFNAQLGAAHLGDLMVEQRGSHILTFVAYNAGGKRAKEWIEAYGDPRTPGVDPIDWVERIPFSETRNYVQRVTENLNVYRARLAGYIPPAPKPVETKPVPPASSPETVMPGAAPVLPAERTEAKM